jgi:hypothetical protein
MVRDSGRVDNTELEARPDVLTYTTAGARPGRRGHRRGQRRDLVPLQPAARRRVRPALRRRPARPLVQRLRRPGQPDRRRRARRADVRLWPTAHRFKRGHRIRVQVSSGAFPRYARNPGTGEPHATATTLRRRRPDRPPRPPAITPRRSSCRWALDRRSNCLEDHAGIRAGLAAGDARAALDYYYGGKVVDGRRFAGFLDNARVPWLARVGLEQTVRDQYDLLVAELPDQATRERKVQCGGHSLGGIITGYFAVWDFDGDRGTTADAGYRQCAGYFALDTTISTSLADLSGSMPDGMLPDVGLGYAVVHAGLISGVLPRTVSAPTLINAETMNLLAIAGLAARTDPDGETLLPALPSNDNIDTTQRILFSKDFGTFLTGSPSVRDFHLTNAAVLGSLLDDNSQPLSFMTASAGFFDGGRIADKTFPVPNDVARDPALGPLAGLLGTRPMAIPDEPRGPLYTWRNYDRIGAPDDPAYRTSDGRLFSTPAEEVTDLQQLARSFAEHPLDFTEQYFPTRLVTDIQLGTAPQIKGFVAHPAGLTARPVITLLAGNGLLAGRTLPPEFNVVIAPGYEHLDVLTAAPAQNSGRPEIVSTSLARFAAVR